MRNRFKTPKRKGLIANARIFIFALLSRLAYRIAPEHSASLFHRLLFSTRPYHLNHAQLQLRSQARDFFVEFKLNKIRVLEWGSGPVIVLVHGWNGRALQLASFVPSLVERGFKVVALDHKGHGESSSRYSSFLEIARGTKLVMAHYGDNLHGVIAHSIGCNAVLKASEPATKNLKLAVVAPMENFPAWLEKMRQRIGMDANLFARVISQLEADTELKLLEESTLDFDRLARHAVLMVHDKFDRINKISGSYHLQARLPGSGLLETENLGHARILGNPEVVRRVVEHMTG